MGNIQIDKKLFPLSSGKWEMLPHNPRLLIQKKAGRVAECNVVCISNQNTISNYQFRSLHKKYLVDILAIMKQGAENFCFAGSCNSEYFLERDKVVLAIQHIPYRLTDLGVLSFAQGVYTIFQCLNGLKLIMEKYGRVITNFEEQMIGINEKGQCKIWARPDYFECVSEDSKGLDESQIIKLLFSRIQDRMSAQMNLQMRSQYEQLKQQYFGKGKDKNSKVNFSNALLFVEALCRVNSFNLDKIRLSSISCLIQNEENLWQIQSEKRKTSLKNQTKADKKVKKNTTISHKNELYCQTNRSANLNSMRVSLSKKKPQILFNYQTENPQKQSRCTMESQRLANSYISLYKKSGQSSKIIVNKIKL